MRSRETNEDSEIEKSIWFGQKTDARGKETDVRLRLKSETGDLQGGHRELSTAVIRDDLSSIAFLRTQGNSRNRRIAGRPFFLIISTYIAGIGSRIISMVTCLWGWNPIDQGNRPRKLSFFEDLPPLYMEYSEWLKTDKQIRDCN